MRGGFARQRRGVDRQRRLRRAGLAHLVAISGLHVGIVVWMLFGSLRRARLAPWARWILTASLMGPSRMVKCSFQLLTRTAFRLPPWSK